MLTSAWHLSSLRRDVKATIRVPLAAVRENSAVQSPNPREFGRMTWTLARAYVVCLRFAQVVKRSKRAAAGLTVAILVAAGLGLSIRFAGIGPEAPPLADLEAPLGGPQDRGPHGTDLAFQTASAAGVAGQSQTHGPAGRIALAVEAAPAAVNRLVEVRRGDTLMKLLAKK